MKYYCKNYFLECTKKLFKKLNSHFSIIALKSEHLLVKKPRSTSIMERNTKYLNTCDRLRLTPPIPVLHNDIPCLLLPLKFLRENTSCPRVTIKCHQMITKFGGHWSQVWILVMRFFNCVTLGKSLSFFETQYSHLLWELN